MLTMKMTEASFHIIAKNLHNVFVHASISKGIGIVEEKGKYSL